MVKKRETAKGGTYIQWNTTQPSGEQTNANCSNMDATRDYHNKWSKSERERQISYDITCVGNIKYGTNEPTYKTERDSDIENRLVFAKRKSGRQLLPYFQKSTKVCPLVQFSLVAQSCPTLCDSVYRSTPGLPIHHQLPESTQTHVHCVGDAIWPSHLLPALLLLPSIFPSIRVFSNESALCIRWLQPWN